MPIRVTCACGKKYTFKDEFAGRRAKCPACGQIVQIPDQGVFDAAPPKPATSAAPAPVPVSAPTASRGVDLADLHSQAFLLLGQKANQQEVDIYKAIIASSPYDRTARFNLSLLLWRNGSTTDMELVAVLRELEASQPKSTLPAYLLGLVHCERGDATAAVQEFENAAQRLALSPDPEQEQGVLNSLRVANSGAGSWRRQVGVFGGHSGYVHAVTFSPDGRGVFSAGGDSSVRLWDPSTCRQVREFAGHQYWVLCVGVSGDGHYLVSGAQDNTLRLWDLAGHAPPSVLRGHDAYVSAVAISPDGQWIVSGDAKGCMRLWDITNGTSQMIAGHSSVVRSIEFSADGSSVLSAGWDETLKLFRFGATKRRSIELVRTLSGHKEGVTSAALVPGTDLAVSCGHDGTVRVWDCATGKMQIILERKTASLYAIALSRNGRHMACGGGVLSFSDNNPVQLWETKPWRCVRTFEGHESQVTGLTFSPDGRLLVSASHDKTVRVWDIQSTGTPAPFYVAPTPPRREVLVNAPPSGDQRPGAMFMQQRARTELYSSRLRSQVKPDIYGTVMAFSPDCRLAAVSDYPTGLYILRVDTGQVMGEFRGHKLNVGAACFSQDERYMLSGGNSFSTQQEGMKDMGRLWDVATKECIATFKSDSDTSLAVAVSPNAGVVALADGGRVGVFDVSSRGCIGSLPAQQGIVTSISFHPDGKLLLATYGKGRNSGFEDANPFYLWDWRKGEPVKTFSAHKGVVDQARFDPTGERVLSCAEGTVLLWDASTGHCIKELCGRARCLAISHDGSFAVGGGTDLYVWNLNTGQCIRTFEQATGGGKVYECVAVAPDDSTVVSGGGREGLGIWELNWECQ